MGFCHGRCVDNRAFGTFNTYGQEGPGEEGEKEQESTWTCVSVNAGGVHGKVDELVATKQTLYLVQEAGIDYDNKKSFEQRCATYGYEVLFADMGERMWNKTGHNVRKLGSGLLAIYDKQLQCHRNC